MKRLSCGGVCRGCCIMRCAERCVYCIDSVQLKRHKMKQTLALGAGVLMVLWQVEITLISFLCWLGWKHVLYWNILTSSNSTNLNRMYQLFILEQKTAFNSLSFNYQGCINKNSNCFLCCWFVLSWLWCVCWLFWTQLSTAHKHTRTDTQNPLNWSHMCTIRWMRYWTSALMFAGRGSCSCILQRKNKRFSVESSRRWGSFFTMKLTYFDGVKVIVAQTDCCLSVCWNILVKIYWHLLEHCYYLGPKNMSK